jgi:hypothetical protein
MGLSISHRFIAATLLRAAACSAVPFLACAQGSGQVPSFPCGGSPPQMIVLAPVVKLSNGEFTDQGADCAMWQTFFYLNWPAKAGARGVPDKTAQFGAKGATVWETFKTEDQVFLPNGAKPSPWGTGFKRPGLPPGVAAQVASGATRLLTRTSKVSHAVAALIASGGLRAAGVPLNEIQQADGNILYDQQKVPVYYDVAMNQPQFDYIVGNGLYNADRQVAYAAKKNIVLPFGSIEVKGAWKVLTAAEAASGRFHTAPGYVPAAGGKGPGQAVTVGLVGMHVFASGGPQSVGLWATFYQVDNAPVAGTTPTGSYSFNQVGSSTPPNTVGTNPTQVVQNFPDTPLAASVSKQAHDIIVQGNAASPWQYYRMVDSQWSRTVQDFASPVPIAVPLATGDVSTTTLVNPVLETFMQQSGTSCLGCHSFATTAQSKSTTATGFSFMFGNAKSAPKKP